MFFVVYQAAMTISFVALFSTGRTHKPNGERGLHNDAQLQAERLLGPAVGSATLLHGRCCGRGNHVPL